ncbi:MAG: BON domain-containing protein [Polyangiales bacterium]
MDRKLAFFWQIEFNDARKADRGMWKKSVFGTMSAGFLGYVVWVSCLGSAPQQIEWDVATRVTERLDRTGFSDVLPVVDGRDVELRGSVASTSEARRAERIVSMVRGVRVVRADMLVVEEAGDRGGDS